MTLTADQRGWGNPGTPGSTTEKTYRSKLVTIHPAGIALVVRREVAPLFAGFLTEIATRGYRLDERQDDWGWANRDIRGRPGVKSNHAWGLAVDVNATRNPMTSDGRVHTDMPRWVPQVAAKYGLAWGGNYAGNRKDPMHFEYLGTPAAAAQLVNDLAATRPRPASPPPKEDDDLTSDEHATLQQTHDAVARLDTWHDKLQGEVDAMKADIAAIKAKVGA